MLAKPNSLSLCNGSMIYVMLQAQGGTINPHCIVILPESSGMQLLLCYDSKFDPLIRREDNS